MGSVDRVWGSIRSWDLGRGAFGAMLAVLGVSLSVSPVQAQSGEAPAMVSAQAQTKQSWDLGASAGVLFPGEMYYDGYMFEGEIETEASIVSHFYADAWLGENLSMGAFVLLGSIEHDWSSDNAFLTTFGMALKGRFFLPFGGAQLRPGLTLGYQVIDPDISGVDEVTGFDVGAVLEVVVPFSERIAGVTQLSFISQPAGGNDDADVTFSPIMFLSFGVEVGG